jgi:leucyl-tRNA synthetase
VEIGVQVNGKVRGTITLAVDADVELAKAAALAEPRIASHVQGKNVRKVIYVKGKILNFILG